MKMRGVRDRSCISSIQTIHQFTNNWTNTMVLPFVLILNKMVIVLVWRIITSGASEAWYCRLVPCEKMYMYDPIFSLCFEIIYCDRVFHCFINVNLKLPRLWRGYSYRANKYFNNNIFEPSWELYSC